MSKMIFLIFVFLMLLLFGCSAPTKSKFTGTTFSDSRVTFVEPKIDSIWERDLQNESLGRYQFDITTSHLRGCAVISFDVDEQGNTNNVKLINSIPKIKLGTLYSKIVKRWKWKLKQDNLIPLAEEHIVRLDSCIGFKSAEDTQKYCEQQLKLACG
jgi:hypothetical protein